MTCSLVCGRAAYEPSFYPTSALRVVANMHASSRFLCSTCNYLNILPLTTLHINIFVAYNAMISCITDIFDSQYTRYPKRDIYFLLYEKGLISTIS